METFTTADDNQPSVEIKVLQARATWRTGTSRWARSSSRHPAGTRGVPQISVTFDIDANGIVHVSAKDLGTGKDSR